MVKEDDLHTRKKLHEYERDVSKDIIAEIQIWLQSDCFKMRLLRDADNLMTYRYIAKWELVFANGQWRRIIRMRLVLRDFMDIENPSKLIPEPRNGPASGYSPQGPHATRIGS